MHLVIWSESRLPIPVGRGRGRHNADGQGGGAKGAKAEVERLVEGDVGREEIGGGRGRGGQGGAAGAAGGDEEEEHQLRAVRCLQEGEFELQFITSQAIIGLQVTFGNIRIHH